MIDTTDDVLKKNVCQFVIMVRDIVQLINKLKERFLAKVSKKIKKSIVRNVTIKTEKMVIRAWNLRITSRYTII